MEGDTLNGIDMSKLYDGIIIGGGPAGLSAAIYLARAKYRVLVIEKEKMGGQITITSEVVNYPGVPETDGRRLTENMRQQAEFFGAEFMMADVKELNPDGDVKKVVTDKGIFETLGIVLATGASPRKIGFEGEIKYQGRGVAYCATCDGEFFTGLDVFVLGGGFAAAEESVFLTKYAKKVTVIVREEDFTCAAAVAEQVKNHPGIEVHYQTEIVEAGGESTLQYAVFRNNETGETWRYEPPTGKSFGIFVFAGYAPATGLFKEFLELNEDGYLVTDMNQKTSKDGIYGAGDICVKNLRQVVTAVSDGAVAATSLEKYLSGMYEKLQLPEREISTPERRKPTDVPKQESAETGGFLTEEMKQQLVPVFERLEKDVVLKFYTDDSPISREVEEFAGEMKDLSPHIRCEVNPEGAEKIELPAICICSGDGTYLGTAFHGVPGGHEFNSFIIAIYNAAGPGQAIDEGLLDRIRNIRREIRIQTVISLSCTMCPELVMAVQRIALENPNVEADIYDMAYFPYLQDKYQIMSVPCMIVNEKDVYFGKKSVEEILGFLEN